MGYLKLVKQVMNKMAEENSQQILSLRAIKTEVVMEDEWDQDGESSSLYEIIAYADGDRAGYIDFEINTSQTDGSSNHIKFVSIQVSEKYGRSGIGTQLYKAFSDYYMQNTANYPIEISFQNPEAERILRKSVDMGIVDPQVLQNFNIKKEYGAKMKNKLLKRANEENVDKNHDTVRVIYNGEVYDNGKGKLVDSTHSISAVVGADEVGYMEFCHYHNKPEILEEHGLEGCLDVSNFYVDPQYKDHSIGEMLYKKFGEIYAASFKGWPVLRYHISPESEQAFNNSIQSGHIRDDNAVEAERVDKRKSVIGSRKDLRKTASSILDLRSIQIEYYGEVDDMSTIDYTEKSHEIYALQDGKELGHLVFSQVQNYPGELISTQYADIMFSEALYVEDFVIYPGFEDSGIGMLMYKSFGEVHRQKFNGWPIARYYDDPKSEAEFRKAIALGYIDEEALNEDAFSRNKKNYENKQDEIKDLRNSLPENVRGPEVWAKMNSEGRMIKAEEFDLESLNIEFVDEGETEDLEDNYKEHHYAIYASLNGERVAEMIFSKVDGLPGEIFNDKFYDQKLDFIYISKIGVLVDYQQRGIATALYKKFGEVYQQNFAGQIVGRVFSNPVAEYAYKKAISMGYIPEEAFNEEYTIRNTNNRRKRIWTDLRGKLPKHVQGPEVWAIRKDLRRTKIADLRGRK